MCSMRTPDNISELPHEMLVHILSLLPMKEAGRTSVLSKRWRDVWAYVPILNFDPGNLEVERDGLFDDSKFEIEESRYVENWVDPVVHSHKAPSIDEFRVLFDLVDYNKRYIDYWIEFAVNKRVKILELDFGDSSTGNEHLYNLPMVTLSLCYSLTSLQLSEIDITSETLETIISNCQALEFLSVKMSNLLGDLKISGPSLNLKSLTLVHCSEMKNLEISAPKLISFHYLGPRLCFNFKSTPKLSELFVCGMHGKHLVNQFFKYSSHASQIEALTLELLPSYIEIVEVFPICKQLKMLDVMYLPYRGEDLFLFSILINACPFLQKFVLQLHFNEDDRINKIERERNNETSSPHDHLKILEVFGFVGCGADIGFVKYLMEIGVSLEKIIIDPRHPLDIRCPKNVDIIWVKTEKKAVRKMASQLSAKLKLGTDLLIR